GERVGYAGPCRAGRAALAGQFDAPCRKRSGFPRRADRRTGRGRLSGRGRSRSDQQADDRRDPDHSRAAGDDGLRADRRAFGGAVPEPYPLHRDEPSLPYRQWLVRWVPADHRFRHGRGDGQYLCRAVVPDRDGGADAGSGNTVPSRDLPEAYQPHGVASPPLPFTGGLARLGRVSGLVAAGWALENSCPPQPLPQAGGALPAQIVRDGVSLGAAHMQAELAAPPEYVLG